MNLLDTIAVFDKKRSEYLNSKDTALVFLQTLFQDYISALTEKDIYNGIEPVPIPISTLRERVRFLAEGIIKALEYSLRNVVDGEAYRLFDNALKTGNIERHIFYRNRLSIRANHPFYRLRKGQVTSTLEEMFHLSFDKRGKASSQRFSLNGFPTLYLCNNVFTGWKELREDAEISCSMFKKVIPADFIKIDTIPFEHRKSLYSSDELSTELVNYALIFPLTAACLLTVPEKDDNNYFKPEYIIPQFLMEWIKSSKSVDGIAYNSSRINTTNTDNEGIFLCFAIPPKEITDVGYCEQLKKEFELTFPIHKKINSSTYVHSKAVIPHCSDAKKVTIEDTKVDYSKTIFAHLESELNSQPTTKLV